MDDDFCASTSSDTESVDDVKDEEAGIANNDNAEKLPSGAENGANET